MTSFWQMLYILSWTSYDIIRADVKHFLMDVIMMSYGQIIIIIMYIYHALINALSAHMIHINLNMISYTHIQMINTL